MRKCIRCQSEMLEDYGLKIESFMAGVSGVRLSKGQGILSDDKGKIKAAVCPDCGEVSLYIDDIHKVK